MFEPEGNACSLTDSTAEEHVLALVEHAADEARDRINRLLPGGKVVLPSGWVCFLSEHWHSRQNQDINIRMLQVSSPSSVAVRGCLCHCRVKLRSTCYNQGQLLVLTGPISWRLKGSSRNKRLGQAYVTLHHTTAGPASFPAAGQFFSLCTHIFVSLQSFMGLTLCTHVFVALQSLMDLTQYA